MATVSINFGKVLGTAAQLELKALRAGVECLQVWADQAAAFSDLASETLGSFQKGEGSVATTAKRISAFGKQNSDTFTELSKRLSQSYFDELGKLIESIDGKEPAAGQKRALRASKPRRPGKSRKRR